MTEDEQRFLEVVTAGPKTLQPDAVVRCSCKRILVKGYRWRGSRYVYRPQMKARDAATGKFQMMPAAVHAAAPDRHWQDIAVCSCGDALLVLCHEAELQGEWVAARFGEPSAADWLAGQGTTGFAWEDRVCRAHGDFVTYRLGRAVAGQVAP